MTGEGGGVGYKRQGGDLTHTHTYIHTQQKTIVPVEKPFTDHRCGWSFRVYLTMGLIWVQALEGKREQLI